MNKFICSNCRKETIKKGHVPKFIHGLVVSVLGAPIGRKVCSRCAEQINGIGALLIPALIVAIFLAIGYLVN